MRSDVKASKAHGTAVGPTAVPWALLVAAALAGCAPTHMADPLTRTLSGSAPSVQGEFWSQLGQRPITANDDAFHALLLYLDGRDPSVTYADRVAALKGRHLLPADFAGAADDAVDRGTLAVAVDGFLHIDGGLTMRLTGPSPRYALRAAVDRGLFPPSSPNQGISGGAFVGVMQRAEEYQYGNPADGPASKLPSQVHPGSGLPAVVAADGSPPVYLDAVLAASQPAAAGPVHLRALVTAVEGDLVEIRTAPTAAWMPARPGMTLREGTEIRTGPKSAIRFLIPTDEAFCLDSQGQVTLRQAVVDLRHAQTRMGLDHGRLREDLSHTAPVQIEQAGLEHDTVIQTPDSALAIRGTKVSLFEQPSFDPVAVSLTGQATFTNVNGYRVPFGGVGRRAVIIGAQTTAAQQAAARENAAVAGSDVPRLEFETRELAIVSQRGGFQRGDVIVGDLRLSDFGTRASGAPALPGGLDFVLQWTGGPQQALNDLNLAVFSPQHTPANPDYVANPPFTVSLTPNSPTNQQQRKATYPERSRTGGQITTNSVGPDGLELAFWPKNYPTGNYDVRVYDLVDAVHPPATTVNPVSYTVDVYRAGVHTGTYSSSIGQLQTSPVIVFPVPAATTAGLRRTAAHPKRARRT